MVKSVPVLHVDVEPNKETPLTSPSLRLLSGAEVPYKRYCRILIICTTPFSGKDANFRSLIHMYM